MSILIALQPDGSRIRYERWVYEAWIRRALNDPFLTQWLYSAVEIYEEGALRHG